MSSDAPGPIAPPGQGRYSAPVPKPAELVPPLLAWFAANARDLPWRRTRDPYAIWISEVMLQQTQVSTVVPYWERWLRELPTVEALARAPLARVLKLWEGLGYYTRARNLNRAAQTILREHDGRFPRRFADVLALPGIGRYTAGAVCSLAFNQPTPVLDGNVIRVLARVFGLRDDVRQAAVRERLWGLAGELVQAAAGWRERRRATRSELTGRGARGVAARPCGALNEALMELGAVVCTPRAPRCGACPLTRECVARRDGLIAELPRKGPAGPTRSRHVLAFLCVRRGRTLVRQRPTVGVNAELWELPGQPGAAAVPPLETARGLLGAGVREVRPFLTVRHAITRNRITLEVYRVEFAPAARVPRSVGRWATRVTLDRLAFAAAHRRILDRAAHRPRTRFENPAPAR